MKSQPRFRSSSQEAFLRLLMAGSALSRQADRLLQSFDISQPQYNVLRILAGAGAEGLGRNEIAARMIASAPDMTRLLRRMEEKGWVYRRRNIEDRREVPAKLTNTGKRLLRNIERPLDALHEQQFSGITQDKMRHLLSLLKELSVVEDKR
jgi:DNA-binding MarR family transcriptional regulator